MMMNPGDLPAHPTKFYAGGKEVICYGLSRRDWFAGQALAGLLACDRSSGSHHEIVADAVQYADALLARLARS